MIFSFVAGFLRFTLSFSIFSSSFIICCFHFLSFFPVVFLCLFNPFSLSISFHFFPLGLFRFSMLLYPLCSLLSLSLFLSLSLSLSPSLPPLLYSFSSFSILGCRVAGLPGCRVAGYHCSSSLKPSAPSRALCSGSNKNLLSISQTEIGISSSPFKVSSCSQKRECQRRESQRRKKIQVVKKAGRSDPNSEMHDDAASFNPSHIASAFPRVWYLARILIAISESSEGRARNSPLCCPF